jgi:hypothetical protein
MCVVIIITKHNKILKDLFVKLSPSAAGSTLLAQFYFEGLQFLMQKRKCFSTDVKVTRLNASQAKKVLR